MSVDMSKWQEIAKEKIHVRPQGAGRLAGKITIVTGAAQGFGKGIAEELYKEGATIVIADMNLPLAESVAAEMGERACAIGVNVSDEESVAAMVANVVEKFGGLDIMVANAGVVRSGPIEGAAMGNLLTQAMALGDIENLDQLRQVVRNSETVNTWNPNHTPEWEEAYQKLLTFLK